MMRPGTSLCMIVKDEANCLADCLKSVQELVREMIIVDTGSSDRTVEVARSFGARVFSFPWNDDFSDARNHSIGYAEYEWIMVLDADEVIDENDHPRIRELIEDDRADGYRLMQRTYQHQSAHAHWKALGNPTPLSRGCPGYTESPLVRLFRNLPHVGFKGIVHELVEHDLYQQGRQIIDTGIPIHHYGKLLDETRLHRKHLLYQRIGENKIADHPTDPRNLIELGVQYLEMDQIDAAVSTLKQAVAIDPKITRAVFNLAVALARQGNAVEAIKYYRNLLASDPSHTGACNNLAQILQNRNESMDEAEGLYRQAIQHHPDHHVIHYNLGLFLEKGNRHQEAEKEFRKSLAIDPDFQPPKEHLESMAIHKQTASQSTIPNRVPALTQSDLGEDALAPPAGVESNSENKERRTGRIIPEKTDMNSNNDIIPRIRLYMDEHEYEKALNIIIDALEKSPVNAELRYYCGYVLEQLGQKNEAIEQYQEALAVDPKHPGTLFQLALEAENQGLMEDCRTLYRELFEVSPNHQKARERYAKIFESHPEAVRTDSEPVTHKENGNRLNIVFVWGGSPFLGDTLKRSPLGGTETALIYMSNSLSRMGHSVRVFVKGGQGNYEGVGYRDLLNYTRDLEKEPADILVASRILHPFINPIQAKIRIFWTEDAHDQPFVEFLARPEIVENIDRIITVSQWQTEKLSETFKIPLSKFYVTRNGVHWKHFKNLPDTRNRRKLVYTSTPYRGLDVLLEIFPRIKEKVPEAELDIYSSMAVYQVDPADDETQFGHLYKLADQPGVNLMGSTIQKALAAALKHAGILAYPNHFAETSCIAVMEAMAAGVPVVTTSLGALPETLAAGGIRIDGEPQSEIYKSRFVDEVCNILTDAERWQELSRQGRNWIYENNRWDTIAKEWESEFQRLCLAASKTAHIEPGGSSSTSISPEQMFGEEYLPGNHDRLDPYFGRFFHLMRQALEPGGSEFGLGVSLFSLAVTINASEIIEIGRFKGFSTLALASALKLLDIGWQEPGQHKQRPDMDYSVFEHPKQRKLYSIDPYPTREAEERIQQAGLSDFIEWINQSSGATELSRTVDLIFIDGEHSYQGCKNDIDRFVPVNLRPGGYFVLHDYFGWYDNRGANHSPIRKVAHELMADGRYEHILMDTGYQSFVVFRKPNENIGKAVVSYG